ncbi:MAG: ABC transporter transmembrane domain-containing protein [Rhodospirillales bacterium]
MFRFIWHFSKRQQITLLLITALSYPFYYYSLDLPKTIVNDAIDGTEFPRNVFGVDFSQIEYLMVLSFAFLALVIINGGLKYVLNVYRGIVGERMLRRLRYILIHQVFRFPLPEFRSISEGEVVAMVTTETEPLGGFIGEALSLPAFQGGMLVTALIFMFVQDWILGLAAIALYPVQAWLIPILQKKVNMLGKERVRTVRKLSERISETVAGVSEIHAHDTAQFELADFSNQLATIFGIRLKIYKLKFFIKFINNFLAQVTPFFFFSIGGYLVIEGDLSMGALVAILAAYKDLGPPWKELLNFYQRMEDARIKYDQLVERFTPPNLMSDDKLEAHPDAPPEIAGPIVAANVTLSSDEGDNIVESANFQFEADHHVAFLGSPGGGKNEIGQMLARQLIPTSGTIKINGHNLADMPESFVGRRLGYVDQDAYIRSGTIRDNLLYGLKHYPRRDPADETLLARHKDQLPEAEASGNSPFDINADWLDIEDDETEALLERSNAALDAVGLEHDVLTIGLRMTINPAKYPELVAGILEARGVVHRKIADPDYESLVETWHPGRYNRNASLAENILFGTPTDDFFAIDKLGENPVMLEALDKVGLRERFIEMGRDVAALMIELFKDLPPGHEFFERYSFIDAEDLPEFQTIVSDAAKHGLDTLSAERRRRLLELPFRLIPSKHRLGLINSENEPELIKLREAFNEVLPVEHASSISFFDGETYNPASSILDNLLFGKIDSSRSDASEKIMELAISVLDELSLRLQVIDAGMSSEVGIAGRRLSAPQRQKLAIARNLIKRPSLLVVNEATNSFDNATQKRTFEAIRASMEDNALVWIGDGHAETGVFDRIYQVDGGRVREASESSGEEVQPTAETESSAAASDVGADTELLSRIPFFAGLDRSRLKLLAFTSERQTLAPREVLFRQGEPGDIACVIVDGLCSIIAEASDRRIKVAEVGRGGLLGELALLCEAPRTATVVAEQSTTVLKIQKDIFIQLIKENPAVGANLSRILASKLEQMMRSMSAQYELYDPITGLPNRNLFMDYLKTAAVTRERLGDRAYLFIFNFPGLDEVLKDATIETKNALVRSISERVKPVVRASDTLANLGGFRLGLIARESGEQPSSEKVIERIADILQQPFVVDGGPDTVDGKLNVEQYPIESANVQSLMENI